MSDPNIHAPVPQGSVILAYGGAPRKSRILLILGLIAGLFVVAIGILFVMFFVGPRIPIPERASLILTLPPGMTLPASSPTLWRDAQKDAKPFPVIVGLREKEDGMRETFAVTLHPFSGGWKLQTESGTTSSTLTRLRDVAPSWIDPRGRAWLHIQPELFLATDVPLESPSHIDGPLFLDRWETSLKTPKILETTDRITGHNMIRIDATPNAWPLIESMLRDRGFDLRLETIPSIVHWSMDDEGALSVSLEFTEPLAPEARIEIAASIGLSDRGTFTLPDGTVMTEFRLPIETLRSSTSSEWTLEDGRKIVFEEKAVFLGNPTLLRESIMLPAHCQGHILATFDDVSTRAILQRFGFTEFVGLGLLVLIEKNEKLVACW